MSNYSGWIRRPFANICMRDMSLFSASGFFWVFFFPALLSSCGGRRAAQGSEQETDLSALTGRSRATLSGLKVFFFFFPNLFPDGNVW